MFTCSACLRRALNPVPRYRLPRTPSARYHNLQSLRATTTAPPSTRKYSTAATQERIEDRTSPVTAQDFVDADHGENKAPRLGRSATWAARKELEYLRDPLHIANRVAAALKKDNFELASLITRQASKSTSVTVSWNHLIDFQLRNGRIRAALKLYNEMKKRAQQPNAQTFTIIFRGCAMSEHPKLAVGEAIKLYQSMSSVGRIKPNTIHLNAVLQVCAKAEDLEAMFSILSSSDDALRSPNNMTYTTVLNAMRKAVDKEPLRDNLTLIPPEDENQKEKDATIKRARSIWEEVISRWRAGSLVIDEELVCAMGRILLMGGYSDAHSIEGLIEQTMMIPSSENNSISVSGPKETDGTMVARPRGSSKAPGAPAVTHASPGNNSLSMILEALAKTRRSRAAVKYWNVFTLDHQVVPDPDNWSRILYIYHVGKNSGRACVALDRMPRDIVAPKHVRLAMKTCLRDNLNKSAFDHATAVMRTMHKTLKLPDIQSLRAYLQVAHAHRRSFDSQAKGDYAGAMALWSKDLFAALDNLSRPYQAVLSEYFVKSPTTDDPKSMERLQNSKAEVVALARKMSAACDILTQQLAASLSPAELTKVKKLNSDLSSLIERYFNTLYYRERTGKEEAVEDNKVKQQNNYTKPGRWENTDDGTFEDNFAERIW
ncbi:hypothetical protein F5Y08DRAFT_111125 [Xylaria arbuscula]|nr:hypothetical protein F5Y08DRAFT_111125 [Xylaria arbuscula]